MKQRLSEGFRRFHNNGEEPYCCFQLGEGLSLSRGLLRYCEIFGNLRITFVSSSNQVRNCYLVSLNDLDGGKDYVRGKISDYFNDLIDIGVKGFRVDASKHMWPGDLEAIQGKTKDLPEGGRPLFFHEVIDMGGEPVTVQEYFGVGKVTEFRLELQTNVREYFVITETWLKVPTIALTHLRHYEDTIC